MVRQETQATPKIGITAFSGGCEAGVWLMLNPTLAGKDIHNGTVNQDRF